MSKPSRGIIYMAIGEKYLEEALFSAQSLRKHMDWPITIYTDLPANAVKGKVFDDIVKIQQSGPRPHRDKLLSMIQSPYEETLFLDTDVYIGASIDDCWGMLKHFDMAVCGDRRYTDLHPTETGVPESFKEVNLGVVFFKKSEKMLETLHSALEIYDKLSAKYPHIGTFSNDQPSFRIASFYSGIAIAPLAEEDNCRFATYGKLNGKVRVLHGRFSNANRTVQKMEDLLKKLNHTAAPRVLVAGKMWALLPSKFPLVKYKAKAIRFHGLGVGDVVRAIVNKVKG